MEDSPASVRFVGGTLLVAEGRAGPAGRPSISSAGTPGGPEGRTAVCGLRPNRRSCGLASNVYEMLAKRGHPWLCL